MSFWRREHRESEDGRTYLWNAGRKLCAEMIEFLSRPRTPPPMSAIAAALSCTNNWASVSLGAHALLDVERRAPAQAPRLARMYKQAAPAARLNFIRIADWSGRLRSVTPLLRAALSDPSPKARAAAVQVAGLSLPASQALRTIRALLRRERSPLVKKIMNATVALRDPGYHAWNDRRARGWRIRFVLPRTRARRFSLVDTHVVPSYVVKALGFELVVSHLRALDRSEDYRVHWTAILKAHAKKHGRVWRRPPTP